MDPYRVCVPSECRTISVDGFGGASPIQEPRSLMRTPPGPRMEMRVNAIGFRRRTEAHNRNLSMPAINFQISAASSLV